MSATNKIQLISDPGERKKIANRLRRAQGQLNAVINSLEDGQSCKDVMQQLSAVSKAIDRAGFLIISGALKQCLVDDESNTAENAEALEKMFLSLA